MSKPRYLRLPDEVDDAIEVERIRRVEKKKDNVTFTEVALDLIRRGLKSLARSRKRSTK